ncbi:MAG: hypothetical protein D6736_14355, partial [Nitrospinota bacterium]
LAEVERQHIAEVLRYTGGNKTRAAEILQISYPTLLSKIRKYHLADPPAPTDPFWPSTESEEPEE